MKFTLAGFANDGLMALEFGAAGLSFFTGVIGGVLGRWLFERRAWHVCVYNGSACLTRALSADC